ncbi:Transcriptional regulatory protein sin3, partial [Tulasnella sp. 417]
ADILFIRRSNKDAHPPAPARNLNPSLVLVPALAPQQALCIQPSPVTALVAWPGNPAVLGPPTTESIPDGETLHSDPSSPAPEPESEIASLSEAYRMLNTKYGLIYLEMVKINFHEQPDVYTKFLDIMNDFKNQTIDTLSLIKRVSTLFSGHRLLVKGFSFFLPQGYYIECSEGDDMTNIITITTPTGIHTQTAGGILQYGAETEGDLLGMVGQMTTAALGKCDSNFLLKAKESKAGLLPSSGPLSQTPGDRHPRRLDDPTPATRKRKKRATGKKNQFLPSASAPLDDVPGPSKPKKPKYRHNDAGSRTPRDAANLISAISPPQSTCLTEPLVSAVDAMIFDGDVGLGISRISPLPIKITGHFCDLFEGVHTEAGRVALKRPRIDATGYNDTVLRLCDTADAVQYLHKEGIVHGDLKANNILVGDNGRSMLCDFGLTKSIDSKTSTTMRGAGTLRWQSPELWNDSPKTPESDVYAFGMTVAEVLTGKIPFANCQNDWAVMQAVMWKDARPLREP